MVFSTNKTDCHNITEILLKVALYTVKQTVTISLLVSFYDWLENIYAIPTTTAIKPRIVSIFY